MVSLISIVKLPLPFPFQLPHPTLCFTSFIPFSSLLSTMGSLSCGAPTFPRLRLVFVLHHCPETLYGLDHLAMSLPASDQLVVVYQTCEPATPWPPRLAARKCVLPSTLA